MSRGRPHHQTSRRRMYSGRQRDLRERRARQDWDARNIERETLEADEPRELEAPTGWGVVLHARATAA